MFSAKNKRNKWIAVFFLTLVTIQNFYPAAAYALTSGPAQPEMQKFQPAGVSNLVDLFSGDLKYDIPLMDVGGYPLNLTYTGSGGFEDEASWVGMGWSLNPGSVNRSVKGLPDDFNGTIAANSNGDNVDVADKVTYTQTKKNYKKIGASLYFKSTFMGWEFGSASMKVNVYKDNYYGIGAGLSSSVDFGYAGKVGLTAGLNLSSDTRAGVTLGTNLSIENHALDMNAVNMGPLTGGFSYNTRSGLESVNLSQSFQSTTTVGDLTLTGSAGLSYQKTFSNGYTPTLDNNTTTSTYSLNVDLGPQDFGVYIGGGASGYYTSESNNEPVVTLPAYGYLNYGYGRYNTNAVLDFNREKDQSFNIYAPSIPIPVATQDEFVATSQAGSAQYRPYYNGEYTVFDRTFTTNSPSYGAGITVGFGNTAQGGGRIEYTNTRSYTQRWTTTNDYTKATSATTPATAIAATSPSNLPGHNPEASFFKKVGELTQTEPGMYTSMNYDNTQRVMVTPSGTVGTLVQTDGATKPAAAVGYSARAPRASSFSYLTAREAELYGLDKTILNGDDLSKSVARVDPTTPAPQCFRKPHHISEVTVTDDDGKRMVYGVPVYNLDQEEVSFSVAPPADNTSFQAARKSGLISYNSTTKSSGNNNGRLSAYTRKSIPPYATSFLLSGILSPDYVDKTGDGISDDDLGTAIQLKYQKDPNPNNYRWRAPYGVAGDGFDQPGAAAHANYDEGFLSDSKDDKGHFVYGTREQWYLYSVSSKTMTAKFFISARHDGLGVKGEEGAPDPTELLYKLDSIQLFSKADLVKQTSSNPAIPIKVAHFEYDYSTYPAVANNDGQPDTKYDPLAGYVPYADPAKIFTVDRNALKGKLTLRSVYFTFGVSTRGRSNPYIFNYDVATKINAAVPGLNGVSGGTIGPASSDPEFSDSYTTRETDRWGMYKQSYYNAGMFTHAGEAWSSFLNNSECPYSLQPSQYESYDTRLLADKFASKYQLNSITTPSGGVISIQYESDDYSYVQDQVAMEEYPMGPVNGQWGSGSDVTSGLIGSDMLYVRLPYQVTTAADFKKYYLTASNGVPETSIGFKVLADLDHHGHYEYVYGYAEVDYNSTNSMAFKPVNDSKGCTVGIPVKTHSGANPVSVAGWQTLQTSLPQYAYENYDNSDVDNLSGDVTAAIKSIVQAFVNLRELTESFNSMAQGKSFANQYQMSHSFIRLNTPIGLIGKAPLQSFQGIKATPTYGKLGGGRRVHKIEISDKWDLLNTGAKWHGTGVLYDYTMQNDAGDLISSGVASYEPAIGNEENPFHQPVPYTEKVEWSQDRYHFMEKPYGESYFPSPSVGYSQVKATPYGIDATNQDAASTPYKYTGYTLSKFFTARDFPTRVDNTSLLADNYQNSLSLFLFASVYYNKEVTSQGFKVTTNDMHGKPQFTGVYDAQDNLITSTEYIYSVTDPNMQQKTLNNVVPAMLSDGTIPAAGTLLGTDEELVTDVREAQSGSYGNSIAYYGGMFYLIFPVPFFGLMSNGETTERDYHSVSTIKVIHQYGILKQTKTTKYGSTLTADNMLWDAQTGDVLLTRMQNEFDDYTYAFNYPAYWAYKGMANAAANAGTVFTGLGTISSTSLLADLDNYLTPGDELVNIDNLGVNAHGWVIPAPSGGYNLIDASGNFINSPGSYKILRSGYRNMMGASAGSLVMMNNPMVLSGSNYVLQLDGTEKVLDAAAQTFKDEWDQPVPKIPTPQTTPETDECQPTAGTSIASFESLLPALFQTGAFSSSLRNIFATSNTPAPLTTLISEAVSSGIMSSAQANNISSYFQAACGYNCRLPADLSNVYYYEGNHQSGLANILTQGDYGYIICLFDTYAFELKVTFSYVDQAATDYFSSTSSSLVWNYVGATNFDCTNGTTYTWYLYNQLVSSASTSTSSLSSSPIAQLPASKDLQITVTPVPITQPVTSTVCVDPLNTIINPYFLGLKGDWRPEYEYQYQVNRAQDVGVVGQPGSTNIRTSGYYSSFTPFWSLSGKSITNTAGLQDNRWEWGQRAIHYDTKGNPIESVDPLNRCSSSLYGYLQSVPVAVASNARYNEIGYDGFEDYAFNLQNTTTSNVCAPARHLDFGTLQAVSSGGACSGNCIVNTMSHSGNYSLEINSLSLTCPYGSSSAPTNTLLPTDAAGHYLLGSNEQSEGFAPVQNAWYVLSFWVNDNTPHSAVINGMTMTLNGSNYDLTQAKWPVVEGWKRVEIPVQMTAASGFTLQLNGNVYIDDFRIMPKASEMKTFVYDDRSMRLMGTLDENNFGTFYEYDEEGTPIRVKRETEKGMMTVKENRQTLRTYNDPNHKYLQSN